MAASLSYVRGWNIISEKMLQTKVVERASLQCTVRSRQGIISYRTTLAANS